MANTEQDRDAALRKEAMKVAAKIDATYEKLAIKLRRKADAAKGAIDGKRKPAKRAVLQRRFELYADAAHDLEERLIARRGADIGSD